MEFTIFIPIGIILFLIVYFFAFKFKNDRYTVDFFRKNRGFGHPYGAEPNLGWGNVPKGI